MRKRIYEIIEIAADDDKPSTVYDIVMMSVIVISLIPLAFKRDCFAFQVIDRVAVVVFIFDYCLRLFTSDYKLEKKWFSFFIYPLTPMAVIDLLSILPSLNIIARGFRIMKLFRLFRTLRVFRAFKAVRYSKSINMILGVFRSQKKPLITVCVLAIAYVLISALVICRTGFV